MNDLLIFSFCFVFLVSVILTCPAWQIPVPWKIGKEIVKMGAYKISQRECVEWREKKSQTLEKAIFKGVIEEVTHEGNWEVNSGRRREKSKI